MNKPRVIGLDLSLRSTGVAGRDWTDLIKPPKGLDGLRRLQWIRDRVFDFACAADLVIVEGVYGSTGAYAGERHGLHWMVRDKLERIQIPVAVAQPKSRAKYATGNGNADKDDVVREVTRRFDWFTGKNDEADALVLAAMGADHLGQPFVAMPAEHRKALAKVSWPEVSAS